MNTTKSSFAVRSYRISRRGGAKISNYVIRFSEKPNRLNGVLNTIFLTINIDDIVVYRLACNLIRPFFDTNRCEVNQMFFGLSCQFCTNYVYLHRTIFDTIIFFFFDRFLFL